MTAVAPAENSLALRVFVPDAGSGLALLMQSGVLMECLTELPLTRLLREEFGIPDALRAKIDVYFLDGQAVDDLDAAIVLSGSRLTLAAGLPGIAGLAMRSGSALAGLRPGITYAGAKTRMGEAQPGRIEVALFSLALPLLAPHFFRRGVLTRANTLLPYMRPAVLESCIVNNRRLGLEAGKKLVAGLPPEALLSVTAEFATKCV